LKARLLKTGKYFSLHKLAHAQCSTLDAGT